MRQARKGRGLQTDGVCKLSEAQTFELIDVNARKYLNIDGSEFLRRRERNEPLANPAWEPINMMAFLLD